MHHTFQQSRDTASAFVGVMIHDGTTDIHQDVFGGANWDNNVWLAVTAPTLPPVQSNGAAAINLRKFIHRIAPHGEAVGPDITGPNLISLSVFAPPVVQGDVPVFNGTIASKTHGAHTDELVALLFGIANGGAMKATIAIVLAAHYGPPARNFILVSHEETATGQENPGIAALTWSEEEGRIQGAFGIQDPALPSVTAVAIRDGARDVTLAEPRADFSQLEDVGIAGTFHAAVDMADFGDNDLILSVTLADGRVWQTPLGPASALTGPENPEFAASGCAPASAKATKWSDWKLTETDADKDGFKKAREAAGRACHGLCGGSKTCQYTETASELLETEERTQDNQTQYRVKVKSEGKCECK